MKMKDGQRMASWISDVKGIVFQLSQIGVAVPDEDIILTLTNGLPAPYNYFILTLDSTPSEVSNLNYIIGCLWTKQTCQRTKSRSLDMTDQALAVTRLANVIGPCAHHMLCMQQQAALPSKLPNPPAPLPC